MHDFPTLVYLRALGASPEATRALLLLIGYAGLAVVLCLLLYGIAMTSLEILFARMELRDRALDRLGGVSLVIAFTEEQRRGSIETLGRLCESACYRADGAGRAGTIRERLVGISEAKRDAALYASAAFTWAKREVIA